MMRAGQHTNPTPAPDPHCAAGQGERLADRQLDIHTMPQRSPDKSRGAKNAQAFAKPQRGGDVGLEPRPQLPEPPLKFVPLFHPRYTIPALLEALRSVEPPPKFSLIRNRGLRMTYAEAACLRALRNRREGVRFS